MQTHRPDTTPSTLPSPPPTTTHLNWKMSDYCSLIRSGMQLRPWVERERQTERSRVGKQRRASSVACSRMSLLCSHAQISLKPNRQITMPIRGSSRLDEDHRIHREHIKNYRTYTKWRFPATIRHPSDGRSNTWEQRFVRQAEHHSILTAQRILNSHTYISIEAITLSKLNINANLNLENLQYVA